MKKYLWIVLLLTVWLTVPALADEDVKSDSSSEKLGEVVVTATRTESNLGRIGGTSVTVITAEDIEAKQLPTVEEVLRGVPGIDISSNGGIGTQSSVFVRGADSKNTLILVDGIMFNDPSGSNRGASLANLTTDNVERIEVVRGPMSVLYGSNATAGVINIITKKGEGPASYYVGGEGGSYNTWKTYGGTSGSSGRFNFSLSASHFQTDGFSIANDENDRIPHDGNTSEDDGWKNSTLSGKFGFDITENFDINFVGRYLDSETDLDQWASHYTGDRFSSWPYTPEPDGNKEARVENEQAFGKINVHNFFFDRFFESNLNFQASNQDRTGYDNDGAKDYDYEGKSKDVNWQGQLNFDDKNLLTLGAGYFTEEMESTSSSISSTDADTTSVWLQDQIFIGDSIDIVAGLRYDDHDKFGDKTTYRVAPAYQIQATNTTLKASYATGFRAPSLFELYSSYGNEDLKPEKSKGWDVGVEQGLLNNKVKIGVTYFDMQYEDRIAFDMTTYKYGTDEGTTKTYGVESFIQWAATSDLDLTLNYTYNDTKDPDGAKLVRRPENKVHVNTRYRILERAMVNLDLFWVGDREASSSAEDADGNSIDVLDEYFLVNLSASYDLNDTIKLYGRIDNVFDEFYEECWSYASAGRSAYAGVKFSF